MGVVQLLAVIRMKIVVGEGATTGYRVTSPLAVIMDVNSTALTKA